MGRLREFCPWSEFFPFSQFKFLSSLSSPFSPFLCPLGLGVFELMGIGDRKSQQMNAKHPFLEKAFLWFAPKDYFSADEPSEARPSLQWEQIQKIRRMAPMTRIIDLDSKAPPKRPTTNPVHLPSVRMIVHAMCSVLPPLVPTAQRRASEEVGDVVMGESSGGGRGENIRSAGPFPMEDFEIGDDVEIDWSDWGENSGFNFSNFYALSVC